MITGAATRAEAAAVLRRFVEAAIVPAPAEGWAKNDAGNWLCYEEHKPATGWRKIDGKWYYFYPDGAMAVILKSTARDRS